MFKSYQVGTLFGIPFKLDITFLVVLPVFSGLLGAQIGVVVPLFNDIFGASIDPAPLTTGVWPWLLGLVAAVVLFGCVTLHELGHSAAALYYGYGVESITLWLLGGIAKPTELPRNWVQEFWIAVAGPLVNVAIVAVCAVALVVFPPVDVIVFLLLYLALLNVGLAAFNMLPAFPLDGGRVLRALLARNRSYLDATRLAAAVGKGFAVLLGVFGLFTFDVILIAIALFVYIAASSEARQMTLSAAFEGVTVGDVMTPAEELLTVEHSLPLSVFRELVRSHRERACPVLQQGEFIGMVTLGDAQEANTRTDTVAGVMTPADELPVFQPSTAVMDAFRTVGSGDVGSLPVVDEWGTLKGLVTSTDLMRTYDAVTKQQTSTDERSRQAQRQARMTQHERQKTQSDQSVYGYEHEGQNQPDSIDHSRREQRHSDRDRRKESGDERY